ncbi:serine hydrolase domain-containing protein [Spirosoma sp. SC4-14]|uniref:serine hydrolase domain-containing protein n=1 Tax=Spirosoma sp. SC4-14 TaxID=3128900 RepID=UPI0030D5CD83
MRFIFSLLLISLCSSTYGQLPDSLTQKIDAVFAEYDKTNTPGCALAILKEGKIIYQRAYGMSNLEYNIAINSSSIFHTASLSKQFTAAALLKLSLDGKLSLTDDIRKYVPEVPAFGHTITLNHLLHHTSGIRDQLDLQWLAGWRDDDLITENDILTMLTRQKALNFIPGEEYAYCNTGYTLAAIAVKRITGISLRDYADSVFFKPLGMSHTHFHSNHSEIVPNRTSAYRRDRKGNWKISLPVFDYYGSTSLFTTVEDLAKWDENFYSKKIGGDALIKLMRRTGELNDGTPQDYASGLVISTYKGYRTEGHSGADAGYRCNMIRFPDQHFSVIVLANLANISVRSLTDKVVDIFLKDSLSQQPVFKTDSTVLRNWAGDYFDSRTHSILNVRAKEGKLLLGSTELLATTNAEFTIQSYEFKFSGDSIHTKLQVSLPGSKVQDYDKVKRINPSAAELQEYTGNFFSSELNTSYSLSIKDGYLVLKMPKNEIIELAPFIKDVFADGIVARFSRNKKKVITGFYLTTDPVRNLYFEKTEAR